MAKKKIHWKVSWNKDKRIDICDICRVRNFNTRNFTLRQIHFTGFIECRLDFIFISSCFPKFLHNIEVLPALLTDHFPLLILLLNEKYDKNGNSFSMKKIGL